MGKLKPKGLDALINQAAEALAGWRRAVLQDRPRPQGLWTYRFTLNGGERERSIGPIPIQPRRGAHPPQAWVADVAAGVDRSGATH